MPQSTTKKRAVTIYFQISYNTLYEPMDIPEHLTDTELFEIEQANFTRLQEKYPDKLTRSDQFDPVEGLEYIGIHGVAPTLSGYLRYYPQDFIVEEIKDNEQDQTTIDPPTEIPQLQTTEKQQTLYADLVKIGIGTFEAVNILAEQLGIPPQKIGYAGMKDGRAVTSQRVSIRGTTGEKLNTLPKSNLFLKPKHTGQGAISPGQLVGNRFTITVRTKETINAQELQDSLHALEESGFLNFFGTQRFGHRMINAYLGMLLSQGNFEEAIKVFLIGCGPFDVPLYISLRKKAAQHYGDWTAMKKIFDILPYKFRHERVLLHSLITGDTPGKALYALRDQVRFWFYSYGSYLVNEIMSETLLGKREIPDPLPMPQTGTEADLLFAPYLKRDGTADYQRYIEKLSFIKRKARTIPAWITPNIHTYTIIDGNIAILSFSLPKGVYATTFLMFLFRLHAGNPIPTWVNEKELDAKTQLHTGSVADTLQHLKIPEEHRVTEEES